MYGVKYVNYFTVLNTKNGSLQSLFFANLFTLVGEGFGDTTLGFPEFIAGCLKEVKL